MDKTPSKLVTPTAKRMRGPVPLRRARGARWRAAALLLASTGVSPMTVHGSDPPMVVTYTDPDFDAVARRTDPVGTAPYDPGAHRLVNLRTLTLGRWEPFEPQVDRFSGQFMPSGSYLRMDLVLDGLHNPPGSIDPSAFDPYQYGDHPVYGFIELDIDDDHDTGGEVDAPQYRYLANIARFGGLPEGDAFDNRVAKDAGAFDGDFLTPPYVERHGEEFHLALLGDQFAPSDIVVVQGNADLAFEAGETWNITGTWFHRAHGFEPFSFAYGGARPGEYAPACVLQFAHHIVDDTTTLSLVFPLTNPAAAALTGATPEPNNHNSSDQSSINEALQDLVESANFIVGFPTGEPEEQLILGWANAGPGSFLQPADWRPTVLLGVSYAVPGYGFVWTDAWPNVLRGNVNGENGVSHDDVDEILDCIESRDADDGAIDGAVVIAMFPVDFNNHDVNHDGRVDTLDSWLASVVGDWDGDGDVDLADFAGIQVCQGWTAGSGPMACGLADLNADGSVSLADFVWWQNVATGPAGP